MKVFIIFSIDEISNFSFPPGKEVLPCFSNIMVSPEKILSLTMIAIEPSVCPGIPKKENDNSSRLIISSSQINISAFTAL